MLLKRLSIFKSIPKIQNFSFSKKKKPIISTPTPDPHAIVAAESNQVVVYVKEMIHTIKIGSKKSYSDFQLFRKTRKIRKTPESYTAYELHEIRRIKAEFIKLIPFSVFMIVPFAEFVLPFYILFFPNAYPSHFLTGNQKKEKLKKIEKKQLESQKILLEMLRATLIANGVDIHDLLEKDVNIQRKLLNENRDFLQFHLDYRKFDSDNLLLLTKLFAMETITGTHVATEIVKHTINLPRYIINLLLFIVRSKTRLKWTHWIFNYEVKFNFFPLEFFKRRLLLAQIEKNIKEIRKQDLAYSLHGFDYSTAEINPDFLNDFARERGFRSTDEDEIDEFPTKMWLPFVKHQISNNLYVWNCVLNFK